MAETKKKKSRAEYQRAWRKKNPGKHKEYQMRYWRKIVDRDFQQLRERIGLADGT